MATRARRAPRGSGQGGSRIHAGLVGERALIGTPYLDDPDLRREYAAEIAPRTAAAIGKIMNEIFGAGGEGRPGASPVRVLDLGAGTGAGGAAISSYLQSPRTALPIAQGLSPEVVAVDRVPAPGSITADLAAPGPVRGLSGRFDLILAAHLLNELFTLLPGPQRIAARASKVLDWCHNLLAPAGTFIILEPALRQTSRELLAVRDRLRAAGLHVVAPCLWQGPCPALARERDWCHDAAITPNAAHRALARVDFSYLVLRRDDPGAAAAAPSVDRDRDRDRTLFRIVSDPLEEKGRLRFFGCGPAGRHPLVRLDRHRTPANQTFDDLVRGDLARITGTSEEQEPKQDGLRIGPETRVVRGRDATDQVPAESSS